MENTDIVVTSHTQVTRYEILKHLHICLITNMLTKYDTVSYPN